MDVDRVLIWSAWVLAFAALAAVARGLFGDRGRARRRCPRCWYEMTGVPGLTCPECGRTARSERALHRARRRWRMVALGLCLGMVAYGMARAPAVRDEGWAAGAPAAAIWPFMPLFDDEGAALLRQHAPSRGLTALRSIRVGGVVTGTIPPARTWTFAVGFSRWEQLLLARQVCRSLDTALASGGPLPDSLAQDVHWLAPSLGAATPYIVPRLERILHGGSEMEQGWALERLTAAAPHARAAVRRILARVARVHPNETYRQRAIMALAQSFPESRSAMWAVVDALDDEDAWVRYIAASEVPRFRRTASAALPALRVRAEVETDEWTLIGVRSAIETIEERGR